MKKPKQKPVGFMVFYDSDEFVFPMGIDPECAGAIQSDSNAPILFPSRKAARQAIEISRRNALLRVSQGLHENTDFTSDRKNLKVVAVRPPEEISK